MIDKKVEMIKLESEIANIREQLEKIPKHPTETKTRSWTEEQTPQTPHTVMTDLTDPSDPNRPSQNLADTLQSKQVLTSCIAVENLPEPTCNGGQTKSDPPAPQDPHKTPSLTPTEPPSNGSRDINHPINPSPNDTCLTLSPALTTSPSCTGGHRDPLSSTPGPLGPYKRSVACQSRGPSQGPLRSPSQLPCIKEKKFTKDHDTSSIGKSNYNKLEKSTSPPHPEARKQPQSPCSTAPRTGAPEPPGQPSSRSPPSPTSQENPKKIKNEGTILEQLEPLPPTHHPYIEAEQNPPPPQPPSRTAPGTWAPKPPGQKASRSPPSLGEKGKPEKKNSAMQLYKLETLPSPQLPHRAADIGPPPPPSSRPCSTAPGTWAPKPPGQQASRSPPSLGEKSKPEKKKSAMQLYKLARQLPDPPPPPSRTADPSPHPSRPCSTAPGTWAPEPPGQAASSSPPSLVQQDRTEKGKLELNRYKQLEPLPDPPPPPSNRAADPSPPLPPPPPRVCSTAPGRWASQSTQASVSSPPPGPTEKEKPKIKKLKINPWQPIESSPSGTPRWASSRTACTPAAGMRGSQPGQHQDCGRTSPRVSVPEIMKIENNSEHAWLDPPVLGREEGQLGQQLRQHQDAGRLREADAGENTVRSPFHRLERTAAKKRGHEDDSEIEQAEVKIAPKKVKNDEKFNEGGGHKAPEKSKIGEKLSTIKEKIAKYNRQANKKLQQDKPGQKTVKPGTSITTTTQQQQQHGGTTTTTTSKKKTTKGANLKIDGQQEITTLFKKLENNNK